jgi:hypothetical protein
MFLFLDPLLISGKSDRVPLRVRLLIEVQGTSRPLTEPVEIPERLPSTCAWIAPAAAREADFGHPAILACVYGEGGGPGSHKVL